MKQQPKKQIANNPMVFRTTEFLAEKTRELADREMVSKSAICRRALDVYIRTDMKRNPYAELPTY